MVDVVGAAFLAAAAVIGLMGTAFATGPAAGSQLPGSALPLGTFKANTPFSSGQVIEVKVPANSTLAAGSSIRIVECAQAVVGATSDSQALPLCDGLTIQGDTILANANGSIDYKNFTIYALPDVTSLGESPTGTPVCNTGNGCVLYVGTDQTHPFSSQHFFSQTWFVTPTAGDNGANPGDGSPPSLGSTSAANTTYVAGPATAPPDGADAPTVTVTLLRSDAHPLPEPGKTVTLAQGSGHSTIATNSGTTNAQGQVVFTVKDSTAEAVTYRATDTTDSLPIAETATVTFAPPVVTPAHSSVAANPTQVNADGVDSSTVTVTLRDQANNPAGVPGKTVALAQGGGHSAITGVSAKTDASGVATFSATDTTTEVVSYTATDTTDQDLAIAGQSATVTFGTIGVSASASTVAAANSPAPVGAVGTQVTVTLLSSGNSPIGAKTVSLSGSPAGSVAINPPSATTNQQGQAVFNVADTNAETVTFRATDATDGNLAISHTASVQFELPAPSATASTVLPATSTIPANGSIAAVITVTIDDQFGTPQGGKTVKAQLVDSSDNATAVSPLTGGGTPGVTNAQGQVVFEIRDTTAENVTFSAVDNTDGFTLAATATVTFTPGSADPNQSTLAASPKNVPNDGKTPSTVTVTLNDHFGNPIPGKTISLAAGGGNSVIATASPTTNASGQATFAVTDTTAEVVTYTATDVTDQNLPLTGQGVAVTFGTPPPPLPVAADSVILAGGATAPADGKTAVGITVVLYDANGLPVAGKTVALNPSGGSSVVTSVSGTSDQDGHARFTVTDETAEAVTYTATDTTDQLPISGQSVTVTFTSSSSPTSAGSTAASGASGTESGATPGGSQSPTDQGTLSSLSGVSSSSGGSAADSSLAATQPGVSLALTGTPTMLPWLLGLGSLLLVVGVIGRRFNDVRS